MKNLTLITSLKPDIHRFWNAKECGAEYQIFCIKSWIKAGFEVISLNNAQEIVSLSQLYPDVKFHSIQDNVPKIIDFLDYAENSEDEIVSIINGDIAISMPENIKEIIFGAVNKGMILSRRIDIDEKTQETSLLPGGVDLFIFHKKFITNRMKQCFTEGNNRIGSPLWDYMMPILCKLEGGEIFLTDKIGLTYHLTHEVKWSEKDHDNKREYYFNFIKKNYSEKKYEINKLNYFGIKNFHIYFKQFLENDAEQIEYIPIEWGDDILYFLRHDALYKAHFLKEDRDKILREYMKLRKKMRFLLAIESFFYKLLFFITRNYNFKKRSQRM